MKKIFVIIFIFLFSFVLRLWNLNQMGRTWDEPAYVEVGYKFVSLIKKGEIFNDFFYEWSDEPPIARYVYGFFEGFEVKKDIQNEDVFNYDYTYARLSSAFISSFSVVLVTLLGIEFISLSVGVYSGIILSMLPLYLGFSQIATLESFLFFGFTASVYSFIRFLKEQTYKNSLVVGIALGLAALSKLTNLLLIPLFLAIFFLWRKFSTKKNKKINIKKALTIFLSSFLTFFLVWPMPLFNLVYVLEKNYELRSRLSSQPSIEVFFGKLIHVPVFYYFVFFIITTPILILILFLLGSKYISDYGRSFNTLTKKFKEKDLKWIFYVLVIWFCFPFIQSLYNFRHQGLRFILEIYAPLALISALGIDFLIKKISNTAVTKLIIVLIVVVYLFAVLFRITPYYIDYYNIIVGGNKNVFEKGLFQFGWWGQGSREAGYYLRDNAKKGSTIGLAVSPIHVFPPLAGFKISSYSEKKKYDYVVVNSFHILREGFNDSKITENYKVIYEVKSGDAILVYIYKHR